MPIIINTYCRINRNGSININTDPTFPLPPDPNFACISGAGVSSEVIGTYQFTDVFATENGVTRPTFYPTFIPVQPDLQIRLASVPGSAVWGIYAPGDEVNYYFGNTVPAPAYPWLETSWTGSPPPTVTQGPC